MIDENSVLGVKENTQKTGEPNFATIAKIYDDGVTLILDGETKPTEKHYKTNTNVFFSEGDRVKILRDSNTYVVEYKVGPPKTQEYPNYSVWGHRGEFLVFFGQTAQGASRQMSVSNLSGSVTISSVANRLNDLLNALRNYNLIK